MPALREAVMERLQETLGPQFLRTRGVAGTALSAFYALGPHRVREAQIVTPSTEEHGSSERWSDSPDATQPEST